MKPIVILFGTETGTAEFVSYEIADQLDALKDATVRDLADCGVDDLNAECFYLIVCATHDDGHLPVTTQPFYDNLVEDSPSLTGLRYAIFGMGDSHYAETYNFGSETIDAKLTELGASRLGDFGRHDASSKVSASDAALAWAERVLAVLELEA